jgi:biopolymer transport protein ExbD
LPRSRPEFPMRKSLSPAAMHAGPNMTPLVDVVMVILIFLMLAGSFGIDEVVIVGKPVAVADDLPTRNPMVIKLPTRLDIHIHRSAGGFDVMQFGGETVADGEALAARLKARHAEYAANGTADDVEIIIRPAAETAWAPVMATYDAALRAKFRKVHLAYAD